MNIRTNFSHLVVSIMLSIVVMSCNSSQNSVGKADFDYDIEAGDSVKLELAANPSTGYAWRYATEPDSTILKFINKEVQAKADSANPMVGAGHTEIWVFKGIGGGTTSIDLKYVRHHNPEEPAREKSYKVRVKSE